MLNILFVESHKSGENHVSVLVRVLRGSGESSRGENFHASKKENVDMREKACMANKGHYPHFSVLL